MSEKLIANCAKLIPYPSKHKVLAGLATAYQFEPEISDKRNLGELFIVIEVMGQFKLCNQIINLIISTANECYFAENEIIDPAQKLEETLSEINNNAINLSKDKQLGWLKKVNAVIGAVTSDSIHLAHCGKANAYLFRNNKLIDLFESYDKDKTDSAQKQVFSSIISGKINLNDKLLIASPALFFQLPDKKLQDIVENNYPEEAVKSLTNELNTDNLQRSAAVVIEITNQKKLSERAIKKEPEIKQDQQEKTVDRSKSDQETKTHQKILSFAKNSFLPKLIKLIKNSWNFLWSKLIVKYPRVSATIALFLVLLISFWIILLIIDASKMSKLDKIKQAISLTESAEDNLQKNEKNLAYANSQKASELVDQSAKNQKEKDDINFLIKKSSIVKQYQNIDLLEEKIQEIIDKSTDTVRSNTTNVVDFSTISGSKPFMMNLTNKNLVFSDQGNNSIYQIDISQTQIKTTISDTKDHVDLTTVSYDNKSVYMLGQSELMQYLPINETLIRQKTTDKEWQKALDIYSYLSNLYLLSPDNKQIYRYTKSSSGFGPKSNYLKTADDSIKDAISLAINGNVFVVLENGEVLMYKLGVKESFAIENLAPNIDGINRLVFDQTKSNLFAISKDKQSIVKLNLSDNKASFEKQYRSDEFKSIDSVSVDSDSKTIYVLSDKKVYKFNYE